LLNNLLFSPVVYHFAVGYTLPSGSNAFFELSCRDLTATIYFQMVWSMMFNAFLFAFFYSRIAKCDSRGAQVILSKKAIVSMVDGAIRFQARCYDVDAANPVVEAHCRMYAVTKQRPVPRPLRLLQPDDDMGAMLFLSVPYVVSHQIDLYSILHPPHPTPVASAGLNLRQADSLNGSRDDVICPVCGESYSTYQRWRNHVMFSRLIETNDEYPVKGTHLELDPKDFEPAEPTRFMPTHSTDELKEYFENEVSEVICVVEGIEPFSSGSFAALQSYQFEDIVFDRNARFRPCVEALMDDENRCIRVDLDRFHEIDIVDEDECMPLNMCPKSLARKEPATTTVGAIQKQRSNRTHDSFFSVQNKSKHSLSGESHVSSLVDVSGSKATTATVMDS
jgi:hypothetical protein